MPKYDVNYDGLPEGLKGGMMRYIEYGIPPGLFLQAVLKNDLADSFAQADNFNRPLMFEIVRWLYNEAPALCWGSVEKFNKWIDRCDE